jgi:molecular chaperone IbpA
MEDVAMRNYDLGPLWRSSIGFDRIFDLVDESLRVESEDKYPPYDIVRTGEDSFRISLAVAGFDHSDISITEQQNVLTIAGKKSQPKGAHGAHEYLYRGISGRPFERRFTLSDYVVVKGATLEHGLLHVDLMREVPEAMKPRRIPIGSGSTRQGGGAKVIEHQPRAA